MDRRLLLLVVAVVALVGVVNATVYAYRWITGTVIVKGPDEATGAACTGFYSSADQPDISGYLPQAGTNHNAQTYGSNSISVTPIYVVCQWTNTTNGRQVQLYEGIDVSIPITVGSWYIQDFYGFGYYNGTDPVYVYFRLEDNAADDSYLSTAKLIVYKVSDSTTTFVGQYDLLSSSGTQWYITSLSSGEALRLDLRFDAANSGQVSFRIGVYVTQEANKAPSNPPNP